MPLQMAAELHYKASTSDDMVSLKQQADLCLSCVSLESSEQYAALPELPASSASC